MKSWRNSWTIYSLGVFIVWAIVLLAVWRIDTKTQLEGVALLFAGYSFGWFSATLKRALIIRSQSTN